MDAILLGERHSQMLFFSEWLHIPTYRHVALAAERNKMLSPSWCYYHCLVNSLRSLLLWKEQYGLLRLIWNCILHGKRENYAQSPNFHHRKRLVVDALVEVEKLPCVSKPASVTTGPVDMNATRCRFYASELNSFVR